MHLHVLVYGTARAAILHFRPAFVAIEATNTSIQLKEHLLKIPVNEVSNKSVSFKLQEKLNSVVSAVQICVSAKFSE